MEDRVWKRPDTGEQTEGRKIEFIRPSALNEENFTGVLFEGTYLESIPNRFEETKNDFKFEKEDGTVVVVNGAGNLGYRMKEVTPGDFCQVSYEGMHEIGKGPRKGKKAHSFDVLVA